MAQTQPPPTRIFLRDRFRLRRGFATQFASAVRQQVTFGAEHGIKLIAACSERPFRLDLDDTEIPPRMMNIWELPEWSTLYDVMHGSSEFDWYGRLGRSIASESQSLLVNFRLGYGTESSPSRGQVKGVYLYEQMRIRGIRVPSEFQRGLLRFSRLARERFNWTWVWSTTQITGQPQMVCLLWHAPSADHITDALQSVRGSQSHKELFQHVATLSRRLMYPTAVDAI
jgi:hypothetical protein